MKDLNIKAIDDSCSREEFIEQIRETEKHLRYLDSTYQPRKGVDSLDKPELKAHLNQLLTYLKHLIDQDSVS